MSLKLKAVDRIFERLGATYGRDFTGRWEGMDQNTIKSSWAHELSGFANSLPSIGWALENLPERAPNVIEFRGLCRRAPQAEQPLLESPKFDKAIAAMVTDGLRKTLADQPIAGRLDWAKKILDNPAGRTPTVVQMAKNAMGAA